MENLIPFMVKPLKNNTAQKTFTNADVLLNLNTPNISNRSINDINKHYHNWYS